MRLRQAAHALLGLGAFAVAGHAGGPAAIEAWRARLDSELAAIQADPTQPLASVSVLAIRDGKVVYQRQFGHRWIDPADASRSKPADDRTIYRIASISKLVTAIGVMRLAENGVLDLDRDLGEYLGYPVRNPHFPAAPITLRMLLSHTSSITDGKGYFWPEGHRLEDVLKNGVGGEFSKHSPGGWFQYANLPWGVIGTVMEKVTGERFDRLMRRLVLDPMGIRGGYHVADLPALDVASIATLYRKRPTADDAPWDPSGPWVPQVDDFSQSPPVPRASAGYVIGSNATLFGPQGNLHVSVADLGRVMRMLMDRGTLDGKRILKAESVESMLSRQWRSDGGSNGQATYGASRQRFNAWGLGNQHFLDVSGPGLGDRLVEGGGLTGVGHLGDAYGLTGAFVFDPARRDGLIFVTGGPGFNPETARGAWSGFFRYEERILTALYRRAINRKAD
jgi:CubicO group peptidase (beta-lactamase class C family)